MFARLTELRNKLSNYTLSPTQYARVAYVALGALTLIVLSGAAVRLTGSGLGCPDWPRCYGKAYPPLNTHAIIEFSNRMITAPVSIAAIAAWVLAIRRRPKRKDLVRLSALLPLGVLGQAVLGGFTVRGDLDYGWVMGHFALSMLILAAAWMLAWRASPAWRQRSGEGDRMLVLISRLLVGMAALTVFAGTAATAAGPHAGGSPGQKINRLNFDGHGTMDFVIHRHGEIGLIFGLVALFMWWLVRRGDGERMIRHSTSALCALLALQGAVGLDQYETHLPTQLVWVHVLLACATWLCALWVASAAGGLTVSSAAGSMAHRPRSETQMSASTSN